MLTAITGTHADCKLVFSGTWTHTRVYVKAAKAHCTAPSVQWAKPLVCAICLLTVNTYVR